MKADALNSGYISGIDGLRAMAVLAVIIYHLNNSTLPGGFSGVDVFFVISGYVISRSLSNTKSTDFFSYLLGFYKRRIIRIFSALLLCLLVTTIASVLFIPDSWLSGLNEKTGLAAFFGISNFVFVIFNDGYFAPRGEFNPFLHTWSLAVEEQFYVIFPFIFFAWLKYRNKKFILGVLSRYSLVILLVVSLIYSYFETVSNPDRAFFLLPSRFWELAIGAFLFQLHFNGLAHPSSKNLSKTCSYIGLILLITGFIFAKKNHFPFPWALIPTAGTLLLLSSVIQSFNDQSYVQIFLKSEFVTYLGKISYSLYLWHWPIYALFRWTVGIDLVWYKLLALIFTFIFSAASYRFVESPIRTNKYLINQYYFKPIILGLVGLCIIFSSSYMLFKVKSKLSLSVTSESTFFDNDKLIQAGPDDVTSKIELKNRNIFILGDSHAGAYETMIEETSTKLGIKTKNLSKGGCPVLNLLRPMSENTRCTESVEYALKAVEAEAKPGDIVFLASLRMYRFGDQWELFSEEQVASQQNSSIENENRKRVETEAHQLIERLNNHGLFVIIDAPKPLFKSPPFRCSDWFNNMNPICDPGFAVKRDILLNNRAHVMATLSELVNHHENLSIWDPFFELCKNENCSAFNETKPMFFDGDHLSKRGNRLLTPSFVTHVLKIYKNDKTGDNLISVLK